MRWDLTACEANVTAYAKNHMFAAHSPDCKAGPDLPQHVGGEDMDIVSQQL